MHSLSAELKSFQNGQQMKSNVNIVKANKSSMPKSSLALMNAGWTDSTGKLSMYICVSDIKCFL